MSQVWRVIVKVRIPVLAAISVALIAASAMAPASAHAQRRVAVRVAPRSAVVIRPSYRPFYDSWYFGYPWYAGYYGGRIYGRPYAYDLSASLRVQAAPRDTEVYVDGYYAGSVDDFDGVFQRLHLEPGEHEIELYRPGHRSHVQRVYLQPGKTSSIRHTMQPIAPGEPEPVKPAAQSGSPDIRPLPRPGASRRADEAARTDPRDRDDIRAAAPARDVAYGTLSMRVQPGDAAVSIDGERWTGAEGDEPLAVEVAAGRHVIDIEKEGYRRYTTEITVRPGETTTLNVALTRN